MYVSLAAHAEAILSVEHVIASIYLAHSISYKKLKLYYQSKLQIFKQQNHKVLIYKLLAAGICSGNTSFYTVSKINQLPISNKNITPQI